MSISAINNLSFKGNTNLIDNYSESKKSEKFTDNFQTKLKNSADMSDCITVPRTIFKGYLGIMTGTTALTVGTFVKNKTLKKALSVAGALISLYGTFAFVRPYILKGAVDTVDLNKENKNS